MSLRWRLAVVCALALVLGSSALASVGPFEVVSRDSSTVLRLQLASQLQTAWESKDKGPSANRDVALYMRARRIRPTLTVSVPEYKTDFRLHVSMAPGSIELMDLYFNTKLNDRWSVRVGQYKIPFTRYRIQSFQRLTFVDWSIVTKYFGAERPRVVPVISIGPLPRLRETTENRIRVWRLQRCQCAGLARYRAGVGLR